MIVGPIQAFPINGVVMRTKSRTNAKLDCDIIHVAERFAASNLEGDTSLKDAQEICSAYRQGLYERGKVLSERFASPEFGSVVTYFARKQFVAILGKCPFPGNSRVRKDNARKALHDAERRCARTNSRFDFFSDHPNRRPEVMRVCLARAREWIRRVLGRFDEEMLNTLIHGSRPGGGVAIGTRNRFRVSLPFKLGDTDLACTESALPYARMLVEGSPSWLQLAANIRWSDLTYDVPYIVANSNKITFVPKDARTLRAIAIEPALNVCLQLGVHSYLTRRLAQFGYDITSQTRNQELARLGSSTPLWCSYATIDLSSASDTLATSVVRDLLPTTWFDYLSSLRCETGIIDGNMLFYEKFSSMGNGFTFALETLIFASLCEAAKSMCVNPSDGGNDVTSVYGDDIIVPAHSALLLTELLGHCGFCVNLSKSYYTGRFRESCGADWLSGYRVTPQYVRKHTLRCTDVYNFLNRLDPIFRAHEVREYLLTKHREKEPVLFGQVAEDTSGCLFAPFDYLKGAGCLKWSRNWQTWTHLAWEFKPKSENVPALTAYAAALKGSGGSDSRYQLRGLGTYRLCCYTPGVSRGLPRLFMS